MTTRDKRRFQAATVARRRWRTFEAWHVPMGKFRKYNRSCNCWLCCEGDDLQRLKLERRARIDD
jgi:hypothetical protein